MNNNQRYLITGIIAFIIGASIVYFIPNKTNNALADIYSLYNSPPPIYPDNFTSYTSSQCDIFGNNCKNVVIPITEDDKQLHFDAWCYSITNQYTTGVLGKGGTVQYFRTMSHDCLSWILDQKLKTLNDKIDNLTKEIEVLKK